VLLGLGWSASTVAASALVSDLASGATRVRVQGRADLVMNIAGAGGAALAGLVLALLGYAGLSFGVMGLVVLVVVGAFVFGRTRSTGLITAESPGDAQQRPQRFEK
jgi:MFS family permease